MVIVSVKDARRNLSSLIRRSQRGERIVITRRGKEVACLGRAPLSGARLPDLGAFRKSIKIKGEALRTTIGKNRSEERS